MPKYFWEADPITPQPEAQFGAGDEVISTPKSVSGFLSNALSSTSNLVKGTAKMAFDLSPIGMAYHGLQDTPDEMAARAKAGGPLTTNPTINNLGNVALGAGEKIGRYAGNVLTGGQLGRIIPNATTPLPQEKYADDFGGYFKDRYGSLSNIGNTLYNDPAGLFADASMAVGGAGAIARGAGLVRTGEALSRTASVLNPLEAAGSLKSVLHQVVSQPLAENLYGKGMRIPPLLDEGKRASERSAQLVRSGLNADLGTNVGSYNRVYEAGGQVPALQRQVSDLIHQATTQGATISPQDIADRAFNTLRQSTEHQHFPGSDQELINALESEYLYKFRPRDPGTGLPDPSQPPRRLTPDEVQADKVGESARMKENAYTPGTMKPVQVRISKALQHESKIALEQALDSLGIRNPQGQTLQQLNAAEGQLYEMQPYALRGVNKEAEAATGDPRSVASAGHLGGVVGGTPGALALAGTRVFGGALRGPTTRLARILYRGVGAPGTPLRTMRDALAASLEGGVELTPAAARLRDALAASEQQSY
jgi:hypothetical protein